MFTNEQLKVIEYCANECRDQQSEEVSVFNMIRAWDYATESVFNFRRLCVEDVIHLGKLVEPEENENGFRFLPITIKGTAKVIQAKNIDRQISNLVKFISEYHKKPTSFYREFEEIHPFKDGNGRVGVILYNLLLGTMYNPTPKPIIDWSKEHEMQP